MVIENDPHMSGLIILSLKSSKEEHGILKGKQNDVQKKICLCVSREEEIAFISYISLLESWLLNFEITNLGGWCTCKHKYKCVCVCIKPPTPQRRNYLGDYWSVHQLGSH